MFQFASLSRLMLILLTLLAVGAGSATAQTAVPEDYEQQLTDARIVAIVMALNELEIQSSNPALTRSTDEDVKNYAQMMTDAHNQKLEALRQLGIEQEPNEVSQTLRDTAKGVQAKLGEQSGGGFDAQYMQLQISLHQNALNLLDYTLIPQTQDNNLRQQLIEMRAKVDNHLQAAWKLYQQVAQGQ